MIKKNRQGRSEKMDESKNSYYKRRSAEAVLLLVRREVQTAAARSLAVDPDGKEVDFVEMARHAWWEAVGEVAVNSVEDAPSVRKKAEEET